MNAKQELIKHLSFNTTVSSLKCAHIQLGNEYGKDNLTILLKVNHTPEEFEEFLNKLDVTYDDGFGMQELFGRLWFTDNSWSDRAEYDGSEWWEHRSYPEIPSHLAK